MSADRRSQHMTGGSVRSRAAAALEEIRRSKAPADKALDRSARGLSRRDRRLLFELVLGSLRWLRRLDWVLERAADRPLTAIDAIIRSPLRIAAYQLLYLDRVPSYAAVDEAVEEVRRRGLGRAAGFANAVLRKLAARRSLDEWPVDLSAEVPRLSIETSHPDFLVERWLERFGRERTVALLEANNSLRPMHLLCLGDRDAIASELSGEGVLTSSEVMSPAGLRVVEGDPVSTEAFRRGRIYVQDDASQAAALVPMPRQRERILDLAAAPGGKGFTLAAVEPSVRIASADLSLPRMLTLLANRSRLRVDGPLIVCDGGRPPFSAEFDRVVADLPCSGTGTIGRHPELKWRLNPSEIDRLAAEGARMLEGAAGLVRPGGLLCAITCSLEHEENEDLFADFLATDYRFEKLGLRDRVPETMSEGVVRSGLWRVTTKPEHDGFTVLVARRRVTV